MPTLRLASNFLFDLIDPSLSLANVRTPSSLSIPIRSDPIRSGPIRSDRQLRVVFVVECYDVGAESDGFVTVARHYKSRRPIRI
jgi:hypothetical protein